MEKEIIMLEEFIKGKLESNTDFYREICNYINTYISNTDWPHSFPILQNQLFSEFLVANREIGTIFINSTLEDKVFYEVIEKIKTDNVKKILLDFHRNFSQKFQMANLFMINPLGIFRISNSGNNLITNKRNMRFTRSDGKYIDFEVFNEEYAFILENIVVSIIDRQKYMKKNDLVIIREILKKALENIENNL